MDMLDDDNNVNVINQNFSWHPFGNLLALKAIGAFFVDLGEHVLLKRSLTLHLPIEKYSIPKFIPES